MKNSRKGLIITVTISVALGLIGMRLLRKKAHHHAHEKIAGDASFDVYADGPRTHILIFRQHGDHQVLVHKKIENGNESEEVELPHGDAEKIISKRSNDVRIAARGEHVLALWQIAGTGFMNRGPLRFAESNDGGRTWRKAPVPLAATRTDDQGFAALTSGRDGKFHAVWLDLEAKTKGLRYSAFAAGKWSAVETIDAATCQCCWNSLRENPQGELMVLYRNLKPRDMAAATRTQTGWAKAGIVDNFGWQIEACPHAGGGLVTAAEATYAVTWTGHETAQGCYFNRRKSTEGKWNLQSRFGGKSARNPDIAANGAHIAIVWDEFEGERRFVKTETSSDNGATWSAVRAITTPEISGSYPRIVANGSGFTAFWSETKNGNTAVRFKNL